MYNKFNLSFLFVFFLIITSCDLWKGNDNTIQYIPVKIGKETAKYSVIDLDGKVVLDEEFSAESEISINGSIVMELTTNGKVRYWQIGENKVTPIGKESYDAGASFYEGYAVVRSDNGSLSLINESGETVVENLSKIGQYNIVRVGSVSDGLLRFKTENGLWGYATVKGEIAIDPKYYNAEDFSNGKARVNDQEGQFYIISKADKILFKGKDEVEYMPLMNDLIPFRELKSDYWGYVDMNGEKVIKDNKFKELAYSALGVYVVKRDAKEWGVIDQQGEYLGALRAKFENAPIVSDDGIIVVNDDDESEIYDAKGNLIRSEDGYKELTPIAKNRFLAKQQNGKFVLIDQEGKELSKESFYLPVKNDQAFVSYTNNVFIRNILRNSQATVESKYFDFDNIYDAVFKNISQSGMIGISYNNRIAEIIARYPYNNGASASNSGRVYFSKGNDFTWLMSNKNKHKELEEVPVTEHSSDVTAPAVDTAEVTAAVDSSPVYSENPLPSPPPVVIPDKYPFLYEYSSTYATNVQTNSGISYQVSFIFDQYLKQPVEGVDPIFRDRIVVTGYKLNPMAQLKQIELSINFNDIDSDLFWKAFSDKIVKAGFVKKNDREMIHRSNATRRIVFGGSYVTFYFD